MPTTARRRLLWPLAAGAALASTIVGTRASLSHPVTSLLAVLLTTAGVAVLVALPGLATLALLSRRPLRTASRFGILLAGSGVAALADFWAWLPSPTLGRVVAAALLVASVSAIAAVRPTMLLDDPELSRPLGVLLLVALGYVGLAYSQGGLGGMRWLNGGYAGDTTIAMAFRYWLAPDNTIPLLFAQRIVQHGSLSVPILADWHTSDRPPLQTGFTVMLYPLFGHKSFAYQFLGTVLQALWVPALWILLRSRGVGTRRVLLAVICTAATGAVFVNTIYVWPKMLGGVFALASLAVLLEGGSLILAAVLAALALLSHGGIVFSVLALLPIAWRLRPRMRQAGLALAAGAVLYLPWIAYQRFVDPPGDRLLKWHLAGLLVRDRHSFLHDLVSQYTRDPLHSLLIGKLFNVETLFVIPSIWAHANVSWVAFFGAVRAATVTSLVIAVGPALIGLAALTSVEGRRLLRPLRPVAVFLAISVGCWVVLEYGGNVVSATVISQGPYAVVVLVVALAVITVTYLPRWAALSVLSASVAWYAIAWLPGLEFRPAQPGIEVLTDWPMILLGLAAVAVAGWLLLGRTSFRISGRAGLERTLTRRGWRSTS